MRDKPFYSRLARLATPIIFQNLFTALMNLVSGVMIGQLGDASVAAQGLAGQINFLLILLLFGISTGGAIFIAQFWGSRSIHNIRKVMGVTLTLALTVASLMTLLCIFFPTAILRIFTTDEQVISMGSQYLRLMAPSFLMLAISYVFSSALRSTGNVKLPMLISTFALALDIGLAYGLIFGRLGLPGVGMLGGALAITIAQTIAVITLLVVVYGRRSPVAATLKEMFAFDRAFLARVLQRALPVVANEFMWGLGINAYNVIYARISTESIAAYNIMANMDNLAMVFFLGLTDACAIIVGNTIGEGKEDLAFRYARRVIRISIAVAVGISALILLLGPQILSLYRVSDQVYRYTRNLILVQAAFFWARSANLTTIVGALRSGGDTLFAVLIELLSMWGVGVSLAAIGAFLLHLPVYYVYMLAMTDEVLKFIIVQVRFHSRKWIHNLVRVMQ